MSRDDDDDDHVEANVQRLADLHAKHAGPITGMQALVISTTLNLARAPVVVLIVILASAWIVYNFSAIHLSIPSFDPPPFPILELGTTIFALLTTLLILATQRREEELARQRAQLTLHLVALCEQKVAKVIELIEEQRRDNPALPERHDPHADDLSQAADPNRVLDRIIETHD